MESHLQTEQILTFGNGKSKNGDCCAVFLMMPDLKQE